MQRPETLCHLKKDMLIDAQEGFVDTFNWMVDFINNLKGDGDDNPEKHITIDTQTSDHPIVCYNTLSSDLSGGGSMDITGTDGETVTGISKLYFQTADDSNVEALVTDLGDGEAMVTLGAYYK